MYFAIYELSKRDTRTINVTNIGEGGQEIVCTTFVESLNGMFWYVMS